MTDCVVDQKRRLRSNVNKLKSEGRQSRDQSIQIYKQIFGVKSFLGYMDKYIMGFNPWDVGLIKGLELVAGKA